jgi:hypothetical protein
LNQSHSMIEASESQHPSAELKRSTVDTGADLCGVGPDVPDESGAGMGQAPLRSSRAGSWGGSAMYRRGLNGLDSIAAAKILFLSSYHVCFLEIWTDCEGSLIGDRLPSV